MNESSPIPHFVSLFGSKTGWEKSDDDDQRVAETGVKEGIRYVTTKNSNTTVYK